MARPLALVTGASAGIGQAFAERLARDGHDLIIVARRRDRLETLARRLGEEHHADVQVYVADLATPAGVDALAERVAAAPLALLVNNAGFGGYRPFIELDPAVADGLLSIHVRAVVQATRAALPGMVERGGGGIINVASLLSLSGTAPSGQFLPFRAVYAASKAFLLAFSQIVAGELALTPGAENVRVQVCLPGIVKTEFHEVQGWDTSKMPPRMSAEDVVQASLSALAKGEVVCAPAVEDAAAIEKVGEAQRAVLGSARMPTLADRYR
jgi:short-subunit dehydrogenase